MNITDTGAQKRMSQMTQEELKDLFGLQDLPASSDALDPKNLPDEDLHAFSYEGLGFEEAAGQLWRHTMILHYHAGTYNRQSEWFPVACAQLEKDIRLAGSFCITRAVLEMQGYVFKNIGNFSIESLCELTAFYFRKCGKAFEDLYYTAGYVSLPMHDWERRWYQLGERLKATGEKIRKILSGEIRAEDLMKRIDMVRPEKGSGTGPKAAGEAKPLELMGGALPLIGSYARQALRERKHETRIRRERQKLDLMIKSGMAKLEKMDKEKKPASKKDAGTAVPAPLSEPRETSAPDPAAPGTVSEKRKELIREAKERGDTKEMMRIAAEPPGEILRRWDQRKAFSQPPPGKIRNKKSERRKKR